MLSPYPLRPYSFIAWRLPTSRLLSLCLGVVLFCYWSALPIYNMHEVWENECPGVALTDDYNKSCLVLKNPTLVPHGASISEAGLPTGSSPPRVFPPVSQRHGSDLLDNVHFIRCVSSISVLIFCYSLGWWERDSALGLRRWPDTRTRVGEITRWISHLYSQLGRTLATQRQAEVALGTLQTKHGLWDAGSIVSRGGVPAGSCGRMICLNNSVD